MSWKMLIQIFWIYPIVTKTILIFKQPPQPNISINDCLKIVSNSHQIWSWVVIHETDQNEPFELILRRILTIGVPFYNFHQSEFSITNDKFMNITTIKRESKIFILSTNHCLVNLFQNNRQIIRLGDKIIYWNHNDIIPRINLSNICNTSGVDTQILNIFSPLITSNFDKGPLKCQPTFSHSMNTHDIFTIAMFKTKSQHGETEYLRLDTFVMEILAESIHIPFVYTTPTRYKGYAGVFDQVASGDAQIVLNSWFLVEKIVIENKVEFTYPYRRDDLVILAPKILSPSRLFYFTYYSYGTCLTAMIMLYFYFRMIKQQKSVIDIIMLFLLICSGNSIKETNKKYFRIIYMSLMFLAFYGYTLFNIQILSALTLQPTDVGIKTVEEFVRTKNPIYCTKNIAIGLNDFLQNDKFGKQLLPRIKTYSNKTDNNEEEHILSNCTMFAVISTKSSARYFSNLAKEQGLDFCYNLIPEAVVPSIVTYIMAYRSPFHKKIDKMLSRIFENGLIANFTRDPIVRTQKYNEELEKSGLTTFRERLPWIVYLCGMFLAITVFIFEGFICPKLIG